MPGLYSGGCIAIRQDLAPVRVEGPRVRVQRLHADDRAGSVHAADGVQVRAEVVLVELVDAVASLPVVHHNVQMLLHCRHGRFSSDR